MTIQDTTTPGRLYFTTDNLSERGERTRLPGEPGSHVFESAYAAALKRTRAKTERKVRGNPGTFDRLVQEYFESPDHLRLATQTQ